MHLRTDRGLRPGPVATGCGVASVVLMAAVAAVGPSAADPGLGAHTWYPPWDGGRQPSSALVTVVLVVAYLLGGAAVALGLVALARGSVPAPKLVLAAALTAVAVLCVLPPMGSADHLSYAAYGRIAAAGADPYVVDPGTWRGGHDPVAGAVQPPWQHTRSVYGPVATALMAATAKLGHGSLRLTVWLWQLLAGLAFLSVALTLDRLTRHDARARARAAVVWTLNPLLLGALVLGGHLDVIAVAFAMAAIALAGRRPLIAGALLGAAVGSKITFGLFALAALWGLRHLNPSWRGRGLQGQGQLRPSEFQGPAGLGVGGFQDGARLGVGGIQVRAGLGVGGFQDGFRAGGPRTHARPGRDLARTVVLGILGALVVLVPAQLWSGPHTYAQLHQASRQVSLATPWRPLVNQLDPVYGGVVRTALGPVAIALGVLLAVLLFRRLRQVPTGVGDECEPRTAAVADAARAAVLLGTAWVLTTPYSLPWYDAMVWAPLALLAGRRIPTRTANQGTANQGTANQGTVNEEAVNEGSAYEGTANEPAAYQGTANEAAVNEGPANEGTANEAAVNQRTTGELTADEVIAEEGRTDACATAPSWPLDAALLARLTVLTLAYVPGRVVDMSPTVQRLTLDYRGDVAPWLNLAVVSAVLWWIFAPPRSRPPAVRRPNAPEPAHSPQ